MESLQIDPLTMGMIMEPKLIEEAMQLALVGANDHEKVSCNHFSQMGKGTKC
jgi:hypothetical protein